MRVVSFTGSTDVGRDISDACAPNFKHIHLEMGGKNVIMVMDDANLDLAVDGALWGGFGTTGQRCTAASRGGRPARRSTASSSSARRAGAEALRVGDGLDATTRHGAAHQPAASSRRSRST